MFKTMYRNHQVNVCGVYVCFLLFLCLLVYNSRVFAITIHIPGYRAYEFGHADGPGDSLDVDGFGRVYVPVTFKPGRVGPAHVQRFTSDGVPEGWSRAVGQSIAVSFDGSVAYLATRGLGENILKINADGTFKELVPKAWEWIWVELDSLGHLYAFGYPNHGSGIYSIDTLNGDYQLIISTDAKDEQVRGDMVFYDGELYVIGVTVIPLEGGRFRYEYSLFRVDGDALTKIAPLPHGGIGLTVDPSGTFYTAASYGDTFFEVWMMKLSGESTLLASGLNHPAGIVYDPTTQRLYVRDQKDPYTITAIERSSLSVSPQGKVTTTWGAIKESR